MRRRWRDRWGAAPDPAGEDDPPRTPSIADGIRLIFQAVCRSGEWSEELTLPGRPALPARLCASAQGKGWEFSEKQARLFSRKSPAFSFARELSWRYRKHQAHAVCFLICCIARAGPGTNRRQPPVADALPAVRSTETSNLPCGELRRNKQSPLWGVAPIEVADQCPWFRGSGAEEAPGLFVARKLPSCPKASGAYCLLFQVCSIARAGPGPGGSWFGGLGAEEAPDSFVLPEAPAVSSFTQPPRSAWRWKG